MSTEEPQHSTADEARTAPLLAMSNSMVRLYKEQFGRGPMKARTNWCGDDVVMSVLEQTLTPAEQNLVKMNELHRLRDTRMCFHYASVREFCEPIEAITGRKVRSYVSGIDAAVDGLSVEVFVLHPEGYEGPSRIERAKP